MDEFDSPTDELAECAQINFMSFAKMNPAFANNPIFHLAMSQLGTVVMRLNQPEPTL